MGIITSCFSKTKTSTPNQSNQAGEAGDAECKIDVEFENLKDTTTTSSQNISLFFSHSLYADIYAECLENNVLDHNNMNQLRDWDFSFSRDPANTKHVTLTITPKKKKTTTTTTAATTLSPILVGFTEMLDGDVKMEFASMVYAREWVQHAKLWAARPATSVRLVFLKTAMSSQELKNLLGLGVAAGWVTTPEPLPNDDHAILSRPPHNGYHTSLPRSSPNDYHTTLPRSSPNDYHAILLKPPESNLGAYTRAK